MTLHKSKKFVFVMGTTASGKSDWALKWAEKTNGVIINCDSVQVYNELKIGSALPSEEDFKACPHYLYSYIDYPKEMTAGEYQRDFFKLIDSLNPEGPIFLVGGTGFYFQAIEKGMFPVLKVPEEIQKQVLKELETFEGRKKLYAELEMKDPESAKKISLNDSYRIARAIELIRSQGGKTPTEIRKEFESKATLFPYPYKKFMPEWDRDQLRERINQRTDSMLQKGLIQEVEGLILKGYKEWAPMSSVGYKETIDFLNGKLNSSQLKEEISTHTYQLAKRQRTWFQRDQTIVRFNPMESLDAEKELLLFLSLV